MHVFISYSHKDTKYAHSLADELQKNGVDVWIDERLDYGSTWPHEIQKQLDSCGAFIVVMSPRSYASDWVQNELNRAKRLRKPIFPLLLEGDGPWLSVESTQFLDVRGGAFPDEKFYSTLKRVISRIPKQALPTTIDKSASVQATIVRPQRSKTLIFAGVGILVLIALGALYFSGNRSSNETMTSGPQSAVTFPTEMDMAGPTEENVPAETNIPPTDAPPSTEFTDAQGVVMVFVPAGNFIMGSDQGYDDEKPVHTVYLDDFYIDKYEVTNVFYRACEDAGACKTLKRTSSFTHDAYHANSQYDNYPVIFVDWDDARSYCAWRGMDLPTEAQWEKAARGTDGRTYPWGEDIDETRANYNDIVQDTTAVGSYENGKSPYGAYDMAGNVWEWVKDWFSDTYYLNTPLTDPPGPTSGEYHVLRGGSWNDDETALRTTSRGWDQLEYFDNTDFGFRCAMNGSP